MLTFNQFISVADERPFSCASMVTVRVFNALCVSPPAPIDIKQQSAGLLPTQGLWDGTRSRSPLSSKTQTVISLLHQFKWYEGPSHFRVPILHVDNTLRELVILLKCYRLLITSNNQWRHILYDTRIGLLLDYNYLFTCKNVLVLFWLKIKKRISWPLVGYWFIAIAWYVTINMQ